MFKSLINRYKSLPVQVRAAVWFLVCSFMQKGISVITTPIFTRLLSPSEYGMYGVWNSWMSIISIFVSLNLCYGIYDQGIVKFENDRKVFISSMQGLTISLVISWLVIYLLTYSLWNNLFSLSTVQMLCMFSMIWTTAVFHFWAGEQRVNYKYKKLVIITLITSLLKPLFGIILVINSNDKATARIIGLAAVELLLFSGMFFCQMRDGKVFVSKKYWLYALSFNIPLIPHYLSQSILTGFDRIMIRDIVGENASGIYTLAYSVSMLMTMFNSALSQTLSPWIFKKIKEKKTDEISAAVYPAIILIAAVNTMLIAMAPEIVAVFAPSEYHDAIWVIPPVAMSVYCIFLYDMFAKIEFYYEKTAMISAATLISAVLNILLNWIFINMFGYYAAGYTTLACYIFYVIFHYIFMCRICKSNEIAIPYKLKFICAVSLVFTLFGFAILLTYKFWVIRYAFISLSFIAIIIKRRIIIENIRSIINLKKQ